jgi:hypothetical protein
MQTNKLRASAIAWILLVPLFMGLLFIGGSSAIDPPVLDETSWTKGVIDSSSDVKNVVSQDIDSNGYQYVSYYDNIGQNLMFATNSGGTWVVEVVDSVGIVGQYSSIAVGDDGKVHISYYDYSNDCLKYAVKTSGTWTFSNVGDDDSVGKYNSMVLDGNGKAHIIYQDAQDEVMRYANNVGGVWQISTVYGYTIYGTALAISDDNVLHAAYVGQNGKVNYAFTSAGNWTSEVVDDASGISPGVDIALVDGKACVAYSSLNKNLMYAIRNDANSWSTEMVDNTTNTVSWVSMDADSYGRVHIVYFSFPNLNYALNDEGWALSVLDENGGSSSAIVSDPNDKQHVVFIDAETASSILSYMTNSGARWVGEVVDEGGEFEKMSSIAVDASGKVHIAYFDDYADDNVTKGRLCYANNVDGWNMTVVDSITARVGLNPSLAVDQDGWVHISYFDDSGQKVLKYVNNVGGDWGNPILIDQSGKAGLYSSLAIGVNSSVHIAYLDQINKDLIYTNNVGGLWVPDFVDDSGTVEGRSVLALDSQGVPHVAYYDGDGLIYAKRNGTDWDLTMLDANNELGGGISMFIDTQDQVYITYYDEILTLLKYINNVGGEWNNATVIASEGLVGVDSAITVDENGDEHIAYVESNADGILNYAEKRSGIWMFQKVDVESCGERISMAMDAQGRAHVTYYDPDTKDLRYATVVSVPSAPTNLTVESEDGYLELDWVAPTNDGGSNITEYRIYWSNASGGPYTLLEAVAADVTEYTHTGLTNGETFFYRVRAVNSEGNSVYSNEVAGTPCTLPGAPVVDAEGVNGAVVLDWDAPDNGGAAIEKYNIYRKNETGVYQLIDSVNGDVTYYKDTGLENGKEYFYFVTAVNPAGEGPESDAVSATPDKGLDMMLIIVIAIVVLAAVGIGAFVFLKKSGKI